MTIVGRIIGWIVWLSVLLAVVVAAGWGAQQLHRSSDEPAEPSTCFVEERGTVCP